MDLMGAGLKREWKILQKVSSEKKEQIRKSYETVMKMMVN